MFVRNTRNPSHCLVHAMVCVIRRFVTLRGEWDLHTPLSVYQDELGQTRLIVSKDIEHFVRTTAAQVYSLDPVRHRAELQ